MIMKLYFVCTQNRLIEAILMSTLNIPLSCRRSKKKPKLIIVICFLTCAMINPQWLEYISMVPKMFELVRFYCIFRPYK